MNDRMNQLAAWLKFYDDQHLAQPRTHPMGLFGGGGGVTDDGPNRLAWAEGMTGEQQPEFFGMNALAPYARPRQFTGEMPQRPQVNDPVRGRAQNYLLQLMGGR